MTIARRRTRSRAAAIRRTDPARTLVIRRTLDAPRDLVFRAWTEPERLVHWWGPQGYLIPVCKMDVRPGGAWRTTMKSPEGKLHSVRGRYREIDRPDRLVFSWAWEDENGKPGHETEVTVTFAALGRRTRLTLHQTQFQARLERDMHRHGWSSSLTDLAAFLAAWQR
jgi:uncharacterized protein YndB with AHSA1/START domain